MVVYLMLLLFKDFAGSVVALQHNTLDIQIGLDYVVCLLFSAQYPSCCLVDGFDLLQYLHDIYILSCVLSYYIYFRIDNHTLD